MLSQKLPSLEKSKINFSTRTLNHAWLIGLSSQHKTDILILEQVLQCDQRKPVAQGKPKLVIALCIKAISVPFCSFPPQHPTFTFVPSLSSFFPFILQFCPVIYAAIGIYMSQFLKLLLSKLPFVLPVCSLKVGFCIQFIK